MAAYFGSRLRKGAATTAVAAAAVAALSASQAPGVTVDDHGRQSAAEAVSPDPETGAEGSATGNSPYYTELPPLNSPSPVPGTSDGASGDTSGAQKPSEAGIPATVLDAYKKAAAKVRAAKPGCNLPWQLLAAIGRVESGHARGGKVDAEGTTLSPILGPRLDGNGFALIRDTDRGVHDGDSEYDRAVGPMQFIPSTWAWAGRDGNGDGAKDPNNVYDAALAAGHYLCRFGWDLSKDADLERAILSYNNSRDYLRTVLTWLEYYRKHSHSVPDGTGPLPPRRSDGTTGTGTGASTGPSSRTSGSASGKPAKPGGGTASPKPSQPDKPATPDRPAPPSKPTPRPAPQEPAPDRPAPSPTPTDTVHHLEDAGTGRLTAMAGDAFAERISTRAETEDGKPVGKVRVRFVITGDTDAVFAGGEKVAAAVTDASGVAVAPVLQAGEKTGDFTVRAVLVGRTVLGVDYTATVTERAADTLTRTFDTPLTCTPGGEFADQVEVRATHRGAVADRVAATATLIRSEDDPTENDRGPYFKDADGNPVRTLTDLRTDDKGLLKLPRLYADDTTGTFLLRITTAGGATLTVELTVEPADPSPSPSAAS
ncbi:lytic murein transglycosylase [Streptomyces thermogriseus]|uniref:Lytic transglycosylase domain-containing protein n=1 Tax=Streptomyces thermogriseus TaxID=75292 RepID=A0ABN1SSN7_9ACTN